MAEVAEVAFQAISEVAAELGEVIRAALVRPHTPEPHGRLVMSDDTKEMIRKVVRDKAVEVCAAITRALSTHTRAPKRKSSDEHAATAPPAPKRCKPYEPPAPEPTATRAPLSRCVKMQTAPTAAAKTKTGAASNTGPAKQATKTTIRVTKFHSVVSAGGKLTYEASLNDGSELKKLHYTDFCRVYEPRSLIALLEVFMDSEFFQGDNDDMRPKVMSHIALLKESVGIPASDHGTLARPASESDSELGTIAAASEAEAEAEQATLLDIMHGAPLPPAGAAMEIMMQGQGRESPQEQGGRVPEQAAADMARAISADMTQKIDVTAVCHATMLDGEVMYTVLVDGGRELMVRLSDIKDRVTDLGGLHECMVQYCQENENDDDGHLKHTVVEHTSEIGRLLPADSGALLPNTTCMPRTAALHFGTEHRVTLR